MDPEALIDDDLNDEPAATMAGLRILVVDDVALNRDLVTALLAPHGHIVDEAPGGAEAVEAVKSGNYDIVLMDVQMPGMNGMEATQTIRAMKGLATLPIIAMTAQALASQWETCREAGMSDHLPKPITPASLFAMLKKWAATETDEPSAAPTGDVGVPEELRDEFLAQCADDLARVRLLLTWKSPTALKELKDLAHRVAGTAAMVGLADLSDDAAAFGETLDRGAALDEPECSEFLARVERITKAAAA